MLEGHISSSTYYKILILGTVCNFLLVYYTRLCLLVKLTYLGNELLQVIQVATES